MSVVGFGRSTATNAESPTASSWESAPMDDHVATGASGGYEGAAAAGVGSASAASGRASRPRDTICWNAS